jgi:hypothetical protein
MNLAEYFKEYTRQIPFSLSLLLRFLSRKKTISASKKGHVNIQDRNQVCGRERGERVWEQQE